MKVYRLMSILSLYTIGVWGALPICGEQVAHAGTGSLPKLKSGTLDPLWGQRLIGADLVAKRIVELKEKGLRFSATRIAVLDNGFFVEHLSSSVTEDFERNHAFALLKKVTAEAVDNGLTSYGVHGNLAASLILGDVVGTGHLGQFCSLLPGSKGGMDDFLYVLKDIIETRPRIMSLSASSGYRFRVENFATESVLRYLGENLLVFQAAGNDFPTRVQELYDLHPAIRIGNINTWGLLAGKQSTEGPEVDVLAPGDDILSRNQKGELATFGGTSAANPTAVGAFSDVLGVLDGVTSAQAKQLLRRTAIPTLQTLMAPDRNGAGWLNAPKLFEVALRLRAKGWNDASTDSRDEMLLDSDIYDFTTDVVLSPEKLLGIGKAQIAEGNVQPGLDTIRIAWHLSAASKHPTDIRVFRMALEIIADFYTRAGRPVTAAPYRVFNRAGMRAVIASAYEDNDFDYAPENMKETLEAYTKASAIRALAALDPVTDWEFAEPYLRKAVSHQYSYEERAAAATAPHFGEKALFLIEALLRSPASNARRFAAQGLLGMGEVGRLYFEKYFTIPEARRGLVESLAQTPKDFALRYLEQALKASEVEVRYEAARVAGKLGVAEIIGRALEDTSPRVRIGGVIGASWLAPKVSSELLKKFLRDPDSNVRMEVVEQAKFLGSEGVSIINDAFLLPEMRDSSLNGVLSLWARGVPLTAFDETRLRQVMKQDPDEARAALLELGLKNKQRNFLSTVQLFQLEVK